MRNLSLLIFFVAVFIACSSDKVIPQEESYLLPWSKPQGQINTDLARALEANKIAECNEIYYRETAGSEENYLVACTGNGNEWKYYVVWPDDGHVEGPYQSETISKPK